jgi:DNA processing protein
MNYIKLNNWKSLPELKLLLDLPSPPKDLFYIGNWDPEIFNNCVAVVGSRKMTSYGEQVIDMLVPPLIHQKKTIVSGFMYGVDQYAHQTCIDNGGKTIAVLGWGIDTPLIGKDLELAKKIIDSGGLIISQWQTQKPTLWTFPQRNQIVAALCKEVLVLEAA